MKKYYTVREVAEIFSVTIATVYSWLKTEDEELRLHGFNVCQPGRKQRAWRISAEALEDFKRRRKI